jgi:hypothetical protein
MKRRSSSRAPPRLEDLCLEWLVEHLDRLESLHGESTPALAFVIAAKHRLA